MFRHPRYLEIPWQIHWEQETTGSHRQLWLLTIMLIVLAMFFVGVGVTSGLV